VGLVAVVVQQRVVGDAVVLAALVAVVAVVVAVAGPVGQAD
jgi:hypothetical protein